MTLAIAILNWNGREMLLKFLPHVLEYSNGATVFVIDNGSTDDSIEVVKTYFPEVKTILLDKNYGYTGGYNRGLKQITADIYCLLNNDVEPSEGWISPILNLFNTSSKIAVVQPKILDYHNRNMFEYAGAGGGFIDNLGYPYCRGRVFWDIEEDNGQYDDVTEIFWGSGACFFIRSKYFWEAGGFDEDFFAHQEEIDLCWRLKNKGYEIYYCGTSSVYHLGGGTLDNKSTTKTYLNIRNSLFSLVKNTPEDKLHRVLFSRMILDGLSGLYFAIKSGPSHLMAIIRGHMHFYHGYSKMKKKRSKNIRTYAFKKYLPFQFFILGRNKMKKIR